MNNKSELKEMNKLCKVDSQYFVPRCILSFLTYDDLKEVQCVQFLNEHFEEIIVEDYAYVTDIVW